MKTRALFLALIFSFLTVFGCSKGYTSYTDVVFSDNFVLQVNAVGASSQVISKMTDELKKIEDSVSLTKESTLFNFNLASANQRVQVDEICYQLFKTSVLMYEQTDGAFNPCVLPLVELWNLTPQHLANPSSQVTLPSVSEVNQTLAVCNPMLIVAEQQGNDYYFTKLVDGVKLDFGGIAKGYATDVCKTICLQNNVSSAYINVSGNVCLYGKQLYENEWRIGITAPRPYNSSSAPVCALRLDGDVSVVTSGDYERYYTYQQGSQTLYIPHIIGKDGFPIGIAFNGNEYYQTSKIISATVVCNSGVIADALSTAYAVSGFDAQFTADCEYVLFSQEQYLMSDGIALYNTDKYNGYKEYSERTQG